MVRALKPREGGRVRPQAARPASRSPNQTQSESVPDIFDEVEEEFRAERARKLLTRYAGVILAAVVLVVGGVAGWRVWQWQLARQDAAAATLYMAALSQTQAAGAQAQQNRTEARVELRSLAAGAPAGYRSLARLSAAAALANEGQLPAALALWNELAADQSADPLLRDVASLLWTGHQLDTTDPRLLRARLLPLAEPDSPWRPLAEEQLALLDLRQNKVADARTTLRRLSTDAAAPEGVRGSASILLQQLGS